MRRKIIIGCLVLVFLGSCVLEERGWDPVFPTYPGAQVITRTDYVVTDSGFSQVKTLIVQTPDPHATVLAWYDHHLAKSWSWYPEFDGYNLLADRQYGSRPSWVGRSPYTLGLTLRPLRDGTEITLVIKRGTPWF